MTPDPLSKLGRFTPQPPRIDRDELLFRAGRSSARVGRGWKAAVAALAVSQAVTIALLVWPDGDPPTAARPPVAPSPLPGQEPTAPEYVPLPLHSYGALTRSVEAGELPPVISSGVAFPDRPPLSVASAYRPSGID
jgi:hypothetical protein